MSINWKALAAVFDPADLEWRLARCGKSNGKIWAMCLTYITNRAIMQRLDDVVGPENWRNEFKHVDQDGKTAVLCGISIRIPLDTFSGGGERLTEYQWVTKWDGAPATDIEAVKGGLSGAMKRSAVQWGLGRYLYKLEENFANVHPKGRFRGSLPKKDGGDRFKWDPPPLPDWALPAGVNQETGEVGQPPPEDENPAPADDPKPQKGGSGREASPKQKKVLRWLYQSHKESMPEEQRKTIHAAITNKESPISGKHASELIEMLTEKWGWPPKEG